MPCSAAGPETGPASHLKAAARALDTFPSTSTRKLCTAVSGNAQFQLDDVDLPWGSAFTHVLGEVPQKHLLYQVLELPHLPHSSAGLALCRSSAPAQAQATHPALTYLNTSQFTQQFVSPVQHPPCPCEHCTTSAQNSAYPRHNSPRAVTQANQCKFAGALKALSAARASSSPHIILPPSAVSAAEFATSLLLLYYRLYFYCSPCTW